MATQVQRRRGTASEHNSFTGAAGEVTVNTTNDSVHVHDGATAGGFETMRVDGDNSQVPLGPTGIQVFESSGTWTKPAGVSSIKVIVTGGGGGGGHGTASFNYGQPGGAGGTTIKLIDVTSISSVSVTVGAGGSGGTSATQNDPAANGDGGGTSSFGSFCSATGGDGGNEGYGEAEDLGVGGTASGGDINIDGGDATSTGGGKDDDFPQDAVGGASFWGGGGKGDADGNDASKGNGSNNDGRAFGSGGGGGGDNFDGASGKNGVVYIEEYA